MVKKVPLLMICLLAAGSCGIEDYIYLEPVTNASTSSGSSASFSTPANPSPEFRYYQIYYRIYLSGVYTVAAPANYSAINPVLASHYNTLYPYTYADNMSPSTIGTVFGSLKYYPLMVTVNGSSDMGMNQLLTTKTPFSVEMDFTVRSPGTELVRSPYLTLSSTEYRLWRSSEAGTMRPNRYFFNTTGGGSLHGTIPADTTNRDVENVGIPHSYAYVSLYVVAAGIDSNFSPVYSKPTHIGVLNLPDYP